MPKACSLTSNQKLPFCNQSTSFADRAHDLIARVANNTLKAQQLAASAGARYGPLGFPELGVAGPAYSEALHGAVCGCISPTQCPSSFPHALLLGASFNRSLFEHVGDAIGLEARAIANTGSRCGPLLWAPNINLMRDPRWGRAMEVPGEDPLLTAEYASRYIYTLQYGRGANASSTGYQRVASQTKHFLVYNLEGHFNEYPSRGSYDAANVSDYDLSSYYLHPWRAAVQKGVNRGVMCSVNRLNGVPACASERMTQSILRGSYHMEGAVVTDGGACTDPNFQTYVTQKYGKFTPNAAVKECFGGGVSSELGALLFDSSVSALAAEDITQATLDTAVEELYTVIATRVRAGPGVWGGD